MTTPPVGAAIIELRRNTVPLADSSSEVAEAGTVEMMTVGAAPALVDAFPNVNIKVVDELCLRAALRVVEQVDCVNL